MKIAIASGKGGTGKTLISTNLFWAAQKNDQYITIVDCDAEEPNVAEFISGKGIKSTQVTQKLPIIDAQKCNLCGACYDFCNYHAIVYIPESQYIKIIEDLCHDCGACLVACKTGAITEIEKPLGSVNTAAINSHTLSIESCANVGIYSPVPVIKKAISASKNLGTVLYDAPPGISCPFIATAESADYVVLVSEPTPFGLNDLKLSVETLDHLNKKYGVVVNRAGLGDDAVYQWLKEKNITLLAEIPFDREIARIYSEGHLLVDKIPSYQSVFTQLLHNIKNQIAQ